MCVEREFYWTRGIYSLPEDNPVGDATWRWASDYDSFVEVGYVNWAPDQPDAGNKDKCMALNPSENYQWDDVSCTKSAYFVCERGMRCP